MQLILFGAGRIGQRTLAELRLKGVSPTFFADNSQDLWGNQIEGVNVLAPTEFMHQENARFIITCRREEEVCAQLYSMGIPQEHILNLQDPLDRTEAICIGYTQEREKDTRYEMDNKFKAKREVFFDFQNGDVLGGVETWSYRTMRFIEGRGYHAQRIIGEERKGSDDPHIIVSNFPQGNFYFACMEKAKKPEMIWHIAIVHNDEAIYYDRYSRMKDYIDLCVVISSKMATEMEYRGFPKEKIRRMNFYVPVDENLRCDRSASGEILRLGYAGRIVDHQKKTDRLLQLAKLLYDRKCNYRFEIAGAGTELDNLKRLAVEQNIADRVIFRGRMEEREMQGFWQSQDVMISCSDFEGHSISQIEAMAAGAVPVITDVSGARDDVVDGVNGFVVPIGDLETMADRVMILDSDRDMLAKMGERAHQTIWNRQLQPDVLEELFPAISDDFNT